MQTAEDISRSNEDQSVSGAWNEGQEFRIGAIDVEEAEIRRDTQAVDELSEDFRVVFERYEAFLAVRFEGYAWFVLFFNGAHV